ncbi:hypothetical protein pdam_00016496 [Pocillopora damicornis]|uniref:Tyrosine-protein kinase catalytic domain-containing protein n=1 Tax=Pocillopora damicornis TaxID=46731 RepID=A0A3M6TUW5_POCDA|nr:hypothetical protein pdam_00016496 [Pocillopora damicornis]
MALEVRFLHDGRLVRFFFLTCVAMCCLSVQGFTISYDKIVKKARCTANCYTQYAVHNDSEKICESTSCTKCLGPCGNVILGHSESQCLQYCGNSSSCGASCEFLEQLNSFASIQDGDGSKIPTPSIPRVINMDLTSLSLQWDPVQNASGTPVYLVTVNTMGDDSSTYTNVRIYHPEPWKPQALPQPAPVSDLALISLVYDSNGYKSNRLKLTANWTQSKLTNLLLFFNETKEQELISDHFMVWKYECFLDNGGTRRVKRTGSTDPVGDMTLSEKLKKCRNTLKVYAMSHCIQSNATSITFEYPVDPPGSPDKDRQVRNLSISSIAIGEGYRFTVNLTWIPPLYPYKTIEIYYILGYGSTTKTSYSIKSLAPAETFEVTNSAPVGVDNTISISTPAVNPAELVVRNLELNDFIFSPQTGTFDLNATWHQPSLNYSRVLWYSISYQVNEGSKRSLNTNKTYSIIHGILHGEPVSFDGKGNGPNSSHIVVQNLDFESFVLIPLTGQFRLNVSWKNPFFNYSQILSYSVSFKIDGGDENVTQTVTPHFANSRIQGISSSDTFNAPVPPDGKLMVQNLTIAGKFVEHEQSNTFAVNFSWEPPSFKYKQIAYYNVSCHFSGYPRDEFQSYTKTNLNIIQNSRNTATATCPHRGPRAELVKVAGLRHSGLVSSADESFRTTVSWQKPLFNHSTVQHYRYKISNISSKTGKKTRRATDFDTYLTTRSNNVTIDGIQMDEEFEFRVIFESLFLGINLERLNPPVSHPMSSGEIIALVIGSLLLILVALCLITWYHRERQRRLKADGLIPGKNGSIIDQWEVDPDRVTLEEEIDEGAFGKVFKGTLKGPSTLSFNSTFKASRTIKGNNMCTVAVKMLHDERESCRDPPRTATKSDRIYVNAPGQQQEETENIQLVSFSYLNPGSNNGEENERKNKDESDKELNKEEEEEEEEESITPGDLMAFAWQISRGMMVFWSFTLGIGGTPYPTIDNKELLRMLKDGYRMEQPETCDNEFYEMMMDCWKENPDQRPGFTQLREKLEFMMQKDNPYLDLSAVDETREYYNVPSFNSIMDESPDEDYGSDSIVQERRKSSTDSVELNDQQNMEQSNGDVRETSEQKGNEKNIAQDEDQDHFSKNKSPNGVKADADVNFDELQMILCRPSKRGVAF